MRRLALTTIMFTFALPVASSHAGFFPSIAVDGGAISETRDVELAPDGTGAVTFVRNDGGVDHAYVNRFIGGRFVGSERVDWGLEAGSKQVAVGAGNGGRLAVMFSSGGTLYGNVRPNAGAPWTGPFVVATGGENPVVKMSIHGVAFAAYTVGTDVLASYMPRTQQTFFPTGSPLDIDQAKDAGVGNGRPRIATSAAGSAVVVWGEEGADGYDHVFARRVFQGYNSTAPQEVSVPSFEGRPARDADLADVAIEDDASFAWVAFRQAFDDGGVVKTRLLVRYLRGATFDDVSAVDTGGWIEGVGEPRIAMNSRGDGIATFATASGGPISAVLKDNFFNPGLAVGGSSSPPVSGSATSTTAATFYRTIYFSEGGVIKGRAYADSNRRRTLTFPGPPAGLTTAGFGGVEPAVGFDVAGDSKGNSLVYFAQGPDYNRTAVVAGFDLPPAKPTALSKWTKSPKPKVTWKSDGDNWGAVTYAVYIGGKRAGATTKLEFKSPKKIKFGKKYKLRVDAVDVRGQVTRSTTVSLALDTKAPSADVKFARKGRKVSVRARVSDKGSKKRPASGIESVRINWGDGTTKKGGSGAHSYASGGKKKVRVTVTDKAGNSRTVAKRV